MKNRTVIETYQVLAPLDDQKGLPIKFEYAMAKILTALDNEVKALNKVEISPVEGQEEFETAKKEVLNTFLTLDEKGQPKTQETVRGLEYVIENKVAFEKEMDLVTVEFEATIELMNLRAAAFQGLLDEESAFEPYLINVNSLPVDKEGASMITVRQMRYLEPFLTGEFDD
jgi:hypothetical protein